MPAEGTQVRPSGQTPGHSSKGEKQSKKQPTQASQTVIVTWRPWDHIFALNKAGKGVNLPLCNPYGKYCLKLFFMVSPYFTFQLSFF